MKKLLILAATAAVISSSPTFADMLDSSNQFYLKASAGVNRLLDIKIKEEDFKFKGKYAPVINLAVGYQITNEFRTELEVGHIINTSMKSNTYKDKPETDETHDYKAQSTLKPRIITLMVGGYYDVADLGGITPFVGGGIGIAACSMKVVTSYTPVNQNQGTPTSESNKSKTKYKLSWFGEAGGRLPIGEGVIAEFAYRFQNYGSKKGLKLQGHNLRIGFAFAI